MLTSALPQRPDEDPFDLHAVHYDRVWGEDPVAQAFRDEVHRVLARHLAPGSRVLDLGCGTGLDAQRLLAAGHQVQAIDASAGMVAQARARGVAARVLPLERAAELGGGFDAALLDFGVVDCVAPAVVAGVLARVLRPGGVAVLVPMPRLHPRWMLGRLRHGAPAQALARLRPVVEVPVEGGHVRTRYLSGAELRAALAPWFQGVEQRGLGLLLPPPGQGRKVRGLAWLERLERPLRGLPLVRDVGDHLVVVLRRTAVPAHVLPARRAAARWTRHRETRRARRTGELRQLRLLILHLTDGCNSRCVACDFRGPAGGEALTAERCVALAAEARAMGCGQVLLTGGEPLLRPDLPEILAGLRLAGLRITLLSNGLALRRHAELVARWCDEVVISLDGEDAAQYRATRGVDGLAALEAGVAALRAQAPGLPVRARVTVTACNAGHLQAIADRARAMGLSSLSLLAADLQGEAFGRQGGLGDPDLAADLAADPVALRAELQALRRALPADLLTDSTFALGRVVERSGPPPCDAPWTSVVVGPDLALRPCFFIDGQGASAAAGLRAGLHAMGRQRAALDTATEPACQRCVCWARLG